MLQIDDLQFNPEAGTLSRDGQDIPLSRLNLGVLATLVEKSPAVVSVDDLLDTVWGNTVVNEETVKQRIKLLRQALGDDPADPRYIQVVRGRGYRLLPDVKHVNAQPGRAAARPARWLVPLLVAAVALIAAWFFTRSPSTSEAGDPPKDAATSLAILPFSDPPGTDDGFRWFADGIQEELVNRLSQVEGLQMRSRLSSLRFRDSSLSPAQIAARLEVDWLLDGSIRRSADLIRISVRLVEPASSETRWAQSYDRQLSAENVLAIQSDIAIQVAQAVRGQISSQLRERLQLRETDSLEAYDARLLGLFHVFRGTAQDIRIAIRQFERATRIDPGYARAWAGLGWAHVMSGLSMGWRPPRPALQDALAATRQGLEADPDDIELIVLDESIALFLAGDTDRALRAFTQLSGSPNPSPSAVINLAFTQALRRDFDSSQETLRRMTRLWPYDPVVLTHAAWMSRAASLPEVSRNYAQAALDVDPDMYDARLALAWSRLDLGAYQAALDDFSALGNQVGSATALARLDKLDEARAQVDRLVANSQDDFTHPYVLALAYIAIDDRSAALAQIQAAREVGGRESLWMTIDPIIRSFLETEK